MADPVDEFGVAIGYPEVFSEDEQTPRTVRGDVRSRKNLQEVSDKHATYLTQFMEGRGYKHLKTEKSGLSEAQYLKFEGPESLLRLEGREGKANRKRIRRGGSPNIEVIRVSGHKGYGSDRGVKPTFEWSIRKEDNEQQLNSMLFLKYKSLPDDDPRPTDKYLPAVIDAAAAASQLARTPTDEPRPKGKGQMFRGIGSLMRRKLFPIVQGAQLGWDTLTPEQRQGAKDFLNTPTHELLGMEKPGIEYFKDLLGLSSPESEGGIMSLPDLTKPAPVYSSAVSDAVNALSMERGDAAQIRSTIANTPGVKPEEMKYQLDKFLEGKGKVTKKEIQDFIAANPVTVTDRILGGEGESLVWKQDGDDFVNEEFGYRLFNTEPPYEAYRGAISQSYRMTHLEDGEQVGSGLITSLEEAKIQAQAHAVRNKLISDEATQFSSSRWRIPGGENYREILLELPTPPKRRATKEERERDRHSDSTDRYRVDDEGMVPDVENEFYGHFDVPNVVAHMRVTDLVGPNDENILFLEEAQSDQHQGARKLRNEEIERIARGLWKDQLSPGVHATPPGWSRKVRADWDENKDRFKEQAGELVSEDFGYRMEGDVTREELEAEMILIINQGFEEDSKIFQEARDAGLSEEDRMKLVDAASEQRAEKLLDMDRQIDAIRNKFPDAPFKKTWHELAFRRALRLAAEEGKDMVAWTPGDMQVQRYGLRGEEAEGMREFYDGIVKNYANKFGKKFGAKVGKIDIRSDLTGSGRPEIGHNSYSLEAWMLEITPEMKRHLLGKGIQKFTRGGFVDKPLYEDARMIG